MVDWPAEYNGMEWIPKCNILYAKYLSIYLTIPWEPEFKNLGQQMFDPDSSNG